MLVYLVNPTDSSFLERAGDRVPVGILQISSYLKKHGVNVMVWDLNHDSLTDFLMAVERFTPDYVSLAVSTPNYQQCITIANNVKSRSPNTRLVAGGNHITDIPTETLTLETYDFTVVGDGELAMLEIVQGKHAKGIVSNRQVRNLDELPYPDYDAVPLERYTMTIDGKKATTVVTSRGCVFSCFYCGSAGSGWRPRSAEHSFGELKMLYDKGYRAFYIADDIFTYNFERVFEFCRLMTDEFGDSVSWRATTRSSLLTPELCKAMSGAGCKVISIGLESGSDKVLKAMKKQTTIEIQERGLRYCKDAGIKTKCFFIFPLPSEDKETASQTLGWAKRLVSEGLMQYCDIYVLTPYPSTPFWNNPQAYGIEIVYPENSDWNRYFQAGIDGEFDLKVKHPNFSKEEIVDYITTFRKEVRVGGLTYV